MVRAVIECPANTGRPSLFISMFPILSLKHRTIALSKAITSTKLSDCISFPPLAVRSPVKATQMPESETFTDQLFNELSHGILEGKKVVPWEEIRDQTRLSLKAGLIIIAIGIINIDGLYSVRSLARAPANIFLWRERQPHRLLGATYEKKFMLCRRARVWHSRFSE